MGLKIIFIALNGIGNTILLTPVFINLKKNLPDSVISVLALNDSAEVVRNSPYVDEVIVYQSKASFFSRLLFLLRLRKKRYDLSFYPYPNVSIMSALMGFVIGAKKRVNFQYRLFGSWRRFFDTISVPVDFSRHDVEKNLDLLRALGMKIHSKSLFIPVSESDKKYACNLLSGMVKKNDALIGMHIGSKEGMRIWPTENFASLAKKLLAINKLKIAIVGTKIEKGLVRNFQEFRQPNIINLIGKTSIPQTTALIGKCRLFISTDSGPMHMAAAAGTKVISIYLGPHIKRTAPFGEQHIVFLTNKATMKSDKNKNHIYADEITPEMVFRKVKEIVSP
ncbi:glycosyltransferase family 9 protein [Candidatus Woesearchaeota archaeon]|nr:glycosyltransferase family 9 protein [Candidatus Woesearchaeota archaeon]